MFYNQPLSIRFGVELVRHLAEPHWQQLDIAVAWVRASGVAHLRDAFLRFLGRGGSLSFVVGLDLQNTSREGLQALLELENYGASETLVFHNEAAGVFHPKLYLARNDSRARLIVGSNNLTESGLFVNVEAGLEIEAAANDPVIRDVLDALASWKDVSTGFSRRLDQALLQQLLDGGYVLDEVTVRTEQQRFRQVARGGQPRMRRPLFASRHFSAPQIHARAQATRRATGGPAQQLPPTAEGGSVLLMRLRKAHATDRPTQTQIPIRVLETGFFGGMGDVESAHSGERHTIREASARGGRNTLKLEIPEMRDFADPVARFERTPTGIIYQTYDVGTPQGNQIMNALREGRRDGSTQLTVPGSPASSTWWRFI
jgi:HKD family nuclease